MALIRLDKFLADAGLGTRSEVRALLKKRLVTVDDHVVTAPEAKIDPTLQQILCRGQRLCPERFHYYMLNKPAGVVTATRDRYDVTVLSLLGEVPGRELFPVGRLDKDTEGLLLITDDGALSHRLLAPRHHVEKTYFVRHCGELTPEDSLLFQQGLDIGEEKLTLPAILTPLSPGEALITLCEGRFHQVKRMFQRIGKPVLYLKRLRMGPLSLDETLSPGSWRPLTEEEITALRAL